MTAYRTSAMPPATDPRRAAALRAYLRRLAPALTPLWQPTGDRDDFLSALQQIAARLAAETTARLDRTAERDALAFFDFLGLPPDPPRAAVGVLVLTLAGNHPGPVVAGARTQLTTDGGASFETVAALRTVPGRIADVIAVDPAADRIEPAPADVVSSAPPLVPVPGYQVVTFAAAGSLTVQLSPAAGPAAGDLLRIGTMAYRVAEADKNGLVTLLDPLAAAAPAGAAVTRIRALESFTLRDRQRHQLYIGHQDLFKLDQPATITLGLAPAGLPGRLAGLDVDYAIWGVPDGASDPSWQPLDLLGSDDAVIRLAKSWPGSTSQLEIGGRRSRWVRASLRTSMAARASVLDPASRILVGVATPTVTPGVAGEGSRTIARAAHNNTPLSTARRFLPFGPEPLRFDEFALAAPEALAKRGATVTLDVTMADASLSSFDITPAGDATTVNGYGVSGTGYLESLSFAPGDFRWRELRPADTQGRPLTPSAPPAAVGVSGPDFDVVVIREPNGDQWAAQVRRATATVVADWNALPRLAGSTSTGRPVLAPTPATAGPAVLLDVAQGGLFTLQLDETGTAASGWLAPAAAGGPGRLAGADRLLPVQGAGWPQRPPGTGFEVVAVDQGGDFWLATAGIIAGGVPATLTWTPLATAGAPPPAVPVRAVATRFDAGDGGPAKLWIAYVAADDSVHGLIAGGGTTAHVAAGRTTTPRGVPQANPAMLGADGHPLTVLLGPDGSAAQIWLGAGQALTVPLGATPSSDRVFLVGGAAGAAADLLVPSAGERLFRTRITSPVRPYVLHDGIELLSADAPHAVEITDDDPADAGAAWQLVRFSRSSGRFKRGNLRVLQVDGVALTAGRTTLRFLRLAAPGGASFDGVLAGPDRRHLQLAAGDHLTRATTRLIIGDAGFGVTGVTAGTAELDHPVPGAGTAVSYQPATVLDTRPVTDGEIGTLAEVDSTVRLDPAATLAFPSASQPATQRPGPQRLNSGLWLRLPGAWHTEPPRAGRLVVVRTAGPFVWTSNVFERGYQNPELSWEYFDSHGWRALASGFQDLTRNLSRGGAITFVVPDDLATTEIGGATDYWIRARLIGGDYGRPRYVIEESGPPEKVVRTVTVDDSGLHPPEIIAIEAGFVLDELIAPDAVLVENNLEVRDETAAAAAAAARFELFQGAAALDPTAPERALYLGLTSSPGQGSMVLLADAADQAGAGPVRVDVRTPAGWRAAGVDDGTRALRRRGLITVTLDEDPVLVRLFGRDRIWLRLRPEATAAAGSWAPVVDRLLLNAVAITHARTVVNEVVGSSLGEPSLTLALAGTPVLPDTVELRVREDLGDEERVALRPVVITDADRLPGSWVLWNRVDSLVGHDGDARVYLLDPGSGRIRFGDGRAGKIPPAGRDNIRCFGYQQGGGETGNQPAWTGAKLTSAVEGVATAVLPIDTAGGFGAPPPAALIGTAPHRLRHAGRALSTADMEALAVASSAGIVRARCAGPGGPRQPIRVTIAVRGAARCPAPTLAQRDAVAATLRAAGWGGLAEDAIEVTGPVFVPVTASVRLAAPRARLAEVEEAARTALRTLLDPIAGGPDGAGWPFGRSPVRSDLLRALNPVPGLARVDAAEITVRGPMPADGLPCAGVTDITVVVEALEGT